MEVSIISGRNEELDGETVRKNILENYKRLEESIVSQLNMIQTLHGATIGSLRETIWQELFERIIPKKFVIVQSVFIIDSHGNISKEVDLAIMDEMYTPYIFRFGKVKFVPIEAVAIVVECKSSSQKVNSLKGWSEAISKLKTCSESITRIATQISFEAPPTQKSTRPIQILCRLNNNNTEELLEYFDFIIFSSDDGINVKYTKENLFEWFEALNFRNKTYKERKKSDSEKTDKEKLKEKKLFSYEITGNPLLSLNFQLNQLLMLINNPMPFPHLAYAEMFNGKKKEVKE